MSPLNRKLLRELWRLRGQVMAIALVIASGVATLVMSLSTIDALEETTKAYYERYRFADVFARVKRAPESLARQISELDGVQSVQTRISEFATVDITGFDEPVIGQIVSVPEHKQPNLNQLQIRSGRWLSASGTHEVILNEPFAQAHGLSPGDSLHVIMNGRKQQLTVVATALCPEFIYSLGPGAMLPDDKRYGIMWAGRDMLAASFDLDASFNDLALTLTRDAPVESVLAQLDLLLERYGGISAIDRADQLSNWFVMNEIDQQRTMSFILPGLFLIVAVFLTHLVLTRLIATERTEIGLLKAFGYGRTAIGWHYCKMVMLIALIGIFLGWIIGAVFGRYNAQMYADLFRYPLLIFRPQADTFMMAAMISLIAALAGALTAVRSAIKLPPAESMRPPSPPVYTQDFLSRSRLLKKLDQPTRIALRQIGRWPLRSLMTSTGIALAVGLVVMTLQWNDSLSYMARVAFHEAQRQNVTLGLTHNLAVEAINDVRHLPGVMMAEPARIASADFENGEHTHRGAITAITTDSILQPVYDTETQQTLPVPQAGLVMATALASKLNLSVGDQVEVEVLEGRRPVVSLPVVRLFNTDLGMPAFMNISAMDRLMQERPGMNFIHLLVDENQQADLYRELKSVPTVSAVMVKQAAFDSFHDTLIAHLMVFITMFSILAALLGFGVAYNSARIALSERGRELATLRVLGFTRGEISYVLLGEVIILILLGLPLGCLAGWGLVLAMSVAFDTELFRIPLVLEQSTFAASVVIILVSTLLSSLLVRRRVNRLNLINVLKTRE